MRWFLAMEVSYFDWLNILRTEQLKEHTWHGKAWVANGTSIMMCSHFIFPQIAWVKFLWKHGLARDVVTIWTVQHISAFQFCTSLPFLCKMKPSLKRSSKWDAVPLCIKSFQFYSLINQGIILIYWFISW